MQSARDERAGRGRPPQHHFLSPLRYPGGKRKLAPLVAAVIEANEFSSKTYVEPFAGGAAVAVHLLLSNASRRVVINDLDPCIASFWRMVKEEPENLCRRLADVRLHIDEWRRQRAVLSARRPLPLDMAVATLYLNRTNRSGVLLAGPIGGLEQTGEWTLDARFNKKDIVRRIEAIAREADRLQVRSCDAAVFIRRMHERRSDVFLFVDPPYYHKAARLYRDDYVPAAHAKIARLLQSVSLPWLLSYDDCQEVRRLYRGRRKGAFSISYTAGRKRQGRELLFAAPNVAVSAAQMKLLPVAGQYRS